MTISLNILGLPVPNVTPLIDWLTIARPPYTLVMDNLELAARVAMTGTQVIFRRYRTDDHRLQDTISPAQFLDSVADVPTSYLVQCLNEPNGNQSVMVDWLIAVITEADRRGRRLVLPNWSVGNPDTEAVANGVYDPLWRAIAKSGRHVLGVHEYALNSPINEPFHIGRYKAILARFDMLKLKRPTIVISEHGRDLAGGHDGWRTVFSEAEYADFLAEAQTVYNADGVCALVFCYGPGFDARWQSFNVEGAPDLLARMAVMNAGEDDAMVPGYSKVSTKTAGAKVNVRSGPGLKYTPISFAVTGDYAKRLPGNAVKADGYNWVQIALDKDATSHVHGWVAIEVVEV